MLIGAIVALIVLVIVRQYQWRRIGAIAGRRRVLGIDGIVVGGDPFTLPRPGAPAVLVLHGAGDTPQSVRYLGEGLHARGFHVHAPLLPGHGRTLRAFDDVTADALLDATRSAFDALCRDHPWVAIAGLSMGGALGVQLAAERGAMGALVVLAPYLEMPRRIARVARWSRLWGIAIPAVASAEGTSVLDPIERARGLAYGAFTPAALRALAATARRGFSALPRVSAPTLMIQSREDNRITPESAKRAFARLGAQEKRLEWITGAAHVITVDYGHEHVIALAGDWLERHVNR